MTIFLDTEFTGLHQSGQLISLALVSLDGRWFYAEFTDYDVDSLSDWHKQHVIPNLFLERDIYPSFAGDDGVTVLGAKKKVVPELKKWISGFEQIGIWADVLAYDWVFFCELFGGSLNLPESIFYIPNDFSTLFKIKNIDPDIARESLAQEWSNQYNTFKHNSLYDAFLLRAAYQKLFIQ
jgi:hypothetical protein